MENINGNWQLICDILLSHFLSFPSGSLFPRFLLTSNSRVLIISKLSFWWSKSGKKSSGGLKYTIMSAYFSLLTSNPWALKLSKLWFWWSKLVKKSSGGHKYTKMSTNFCLILQLNGSENDLKPRIYYNTLISFFTELSDLADLVQYPLCRKNLIKQGKNLS